MRVPNPIVTFLSGRVFDRVIFKSDVMMKDYWFVWSEDYEPIRLTYEGNEITSALHRRHWKHIEVHNPYKNDLGRIETFFLPFTHTPVVRKAQQDLDFYILIKTMSQQRLEDYNLIDEPIPEYFTCTGTKDRHPPSVEYHGWENLV